MTWASCQSWTSTTNPIALTCSSSRGKRITCQVRSAAAICILQRCTSDLRRKDLLRLRIWRIWRHRWTVETTRWMSLLRACSNLRKYQTTHPKRPAKLLDSTALCQSLLCSSVELRANQSRWRWTFQVDLARKEIESTARHNQLQSQPCLKTQSTSIAPNSRSPSSDIKVWILTKLLQATSRG